jgi:hypothetical protein
LPIDRNNERRLPLVGGVFSFGADTKKADTGTVMV